MGPTRLSGVRISLASQPTFFRSTDRFQYRHAEEWSGDLGQLHVKPLERNNWFESREKTPTVTAVVKCAIMVERALRL